MGQTGTGRHESAGAPRPEPSVAIIGSGFGGLCAAIQLARSGNRRFTIFEKDATLGGTWRDNHYPGAACDVPSHLYCYSFAPKKDWSRKFAEQPEILRYLNDVADRFGIRRHIKFHSEVTALDWIEDSMTWTVSTAGGERYEFSAVVIAVGQLHKPFVPSIPGRDDFSGAQFHSARWDDRVRLADKDVAVVGNGASVVQFLPHVAAEARSVTMFQRTPNYVGPKNDERYAGARLRRFRAPGRARLERLKIWLMLESRFLLMRRNSKVGRLLKNRFDQGLDKVASDDLPKSVLMPDYQPGCKRILISDDWYQTLHRPNVHVVSDPINSIDRDGLTTPAGHIDADVIIYGTGFETNDFVAPIDVHGDDGQELSAAWKNGAEAYLGIAVSGFPNLFMLYGPNTNLGHNSIVFMIEQQVAWIMRVLARMTERRADAVEVPRSLQHEFNTGLRRDLERTVWATDCDSWYKNSAGKITNNWSGLTIQYRRATRRSDVSRLDYRSVDAGAGSSALMAPRQTIDA